MKSVTRRGAWIAGLVVALGLAGFGGASGASYDGAIASAGRATGLATDVSVHTQLATTGADTDFGFSLAVMC